MSRPEKRGQRGKIIPLSQGEARISAAVHPISLDDFHAYMPQHSYIFTPTRELWPAASVNARLPPVIGPDGKPIAAERVARPERGGRADDVGAGRADADQGPADRRRRLDRAAGMRDLQPVPATARSCRSRATSRRGSSLVDKVYPDEAEHIISWLAHRVQRPHEKINHALVLGGKQGIGKDTLLEPVKQAVGPWNFAEVSPQAGARPLQRLRASR